MSLIKDSSECCKSELDLFYTLPTNTSILSSNYVKYRPKQTFTPTQTTFEIEIDGTPNYTDLNDIYLSTEVQLVKKTTSGTTYNQNFAIGPVNNLAHSLFERIDFEVYTGNKYTLVEKG